MKASGNAAPETCVQNLLKTIRGEVPYDRIKGIDRTLIDKRAGRPPTIWPPTWSSSWKPTSPACA